MNSVISIFADSKHPVDRKGIRERMAYVLSKHGLATGVQVDILIVGRRKMANLHLKYLSLAGPTDVLSFPLNDAAAGAAFVASPDDVLRLGDIVICYPVALEEALAKQIRVDEQVQFLAEHGLMHLLGYHHE